MSFWDRMHVCVHNTSYSLTTSPLSHTCFCVVGENHSAEAYVAPNDSNEEFEGWTPPHSRYFIVKKNWLGFWVLRIGGDVAMVEPDTSWHFSKRKAEIRGKDWVDYGFYGRRDD
jgi:hypothetical protein